MENQLSLNKTVPEEENTVANKLKILFFNISKSLDMKYDKAERIGTLSRYITQESKRIIFLLHRLSIEENVLTKAESRLRNMRGQGGIYVFKELAKELKNEDIFYYLRCFTAGLQEYVEAVALWKYLKDGTLVSQEEVQTILTFKIQSSHTLECSENKTDNNDSDEHLDHEETELTVPVPLTDFILGLADFTGELMRACVTAVAAGDKTFVYRTKDIVQEIHKRMSALHYPRRDLLRKMNVLQNSVMKMESACYNLKIRDCFESKNFQNWLPDDDHHERGYDSGYD